MKTGMERDYQFDNPNFNFNEFLSNLVLRWNIYPGRRSTLYGRKPSIEASSGISTFTQPQPALQLRKAKQYRHAKTFIPYRHALKLVLK